MRVSGNAGPSRRSLMCGLLALLSEVANHSRHQAVPPYARVHKRRDLLQSHFSPANNSDRCMQLVIDYLDLLSGLKEPIRNWRRDKTR